MGKYSNFYSPTGIDFCPSGMIAPQEVEMEGEAKIRAKSKHQCVTPDIKYREKTGEITF